MKASFLVRAAAVVTLGFAPGIVAADDAPAAPAAAATQPSAHVSDEAKAILDQVADAYSKLKSLQLAGHISVDLQIEGSAPQKHTADLTSSFVAPNQFRHEIKNDVLVGSTGQKLYTFQPAENTYTLADAPKERAASKDLPKPLVGLLEMQDPSLLLAIAKNPSEELTADVTDISKIDDTKIADASYPTLKILQKDKSSVRLAIDATSHLIREMTVDLTPTLKPRRADLASAIVTIDYTTTTADQPAKNESFAWTPPAGAKDGAAMAAAQAQDAPPASDLEGKAAPDFKLNGLDGKAVALSDLKGKVVVIDFWATWCPPCRASLPHLDKLYQAQKEKGLQVFAADQQEEKADVEQFVKQTNLNVPVLLDTDGKVGQEYGVTGIPQTVVVGKDGKIRKIFVGFDPSASPEELQKVVDAAMKE